MRKKKRGKDRVPRQPRHCTREVRQAYERWRREQKIGGSAPKPPHVSLGKQYLQAKGLQSVPTERVIQSWAIRCAEGANPQLQRLCVGGPRREVRWRAEMK